jgi:glyoxylase-like metal-dependent hydrolase (beta-lactamase superfamily II)
MKKKEKQSSEPGMRIKTFQGGFDRNLSYLIWCEKTRMAAIVDPSVEPEPIWDTLQEHHLLLDKIFITHTHHDHLTYLDDFLSYRPLARVIGYKNPEKQVADDNYRGVSHNEVIALGEHMITALHTPGHYPDSMCYWHPVLNWIFTGDTMFIGRTGRTVGVGSDVSTLYQSVYHILLKLRGDTRIFPGHHYGYAPSATIRENRKYSPFFQCKSESEFISVMHTFERTRQYRK